MIHQDSHRIGRQGALCSSCVSAAGGIRYILCFISAILLSLVLPRLKLKNKSAALMSFPSVDYVGQKRPKQQLRQETQLRAHI